MRLLAALLILSTAAAAAPPRAPIELWRLDCGAFVKRGLVNSCYLIRHGSQLMLWDTGFGTEAPAKYESIRLGATLASELARIGIRPEQIDLVALSHIHGDHIGQAATFATARLLIGKADWDALAQPAHSGEAAQLAPWVTGHAPKSLVAGDRDIFGDGSVAMLATPGHTPGHHSLLVRLAARGTVLLTGDLYYSAQQYASRSVPVHNDNAARTLASFRRFDALAAASHATVIIQHEPQDVAKLPGFPVSAD
jgi:N-acyl homoserine lactone hydrolase